MVDVSEDDTSDLLTVKTRTSEFNRGKQNLEDYPRFERPANVNTDKKTLIVFSTLLCRTYELL